jgi:predicted phosphodiesterase
MEERLKRRENEEKEEYIWRMYENKIANELTNNQVRDVICDTLNINVRESYLRGIAKNFGIGYKKKEIKDDFDKSVMIINDVHAPFEREDFLEIITKHAHEIDTLVIGGDFMDCETISSFPKINRSSLTEELVYSYNLMKKIRKILNKGQKIVLINGNHEERLKMMISKMHEKDLQKFINPNILEMLVDGFTIYEDNKKVKYEGIEGITYIPHWYVNIDNKIIISHPKDFSGVDGKMCEKISEHFLNKHEEFEILLFAHTHKHSQMKVSRRQGVYVVENGCLCKNHEYADCGKLGYTPQDYCYTIIKYNNDEKINYNNIQVYHLDDLETKQENYKVFI